MERKTQLKQTSANDASVEEQSQLVIMDQDRKKKLGFGLTVLFLTGELIGAGVLALPYTVITAGYYSFALIVIIGLLACFGGVKLGRCWQLIIERWPQYDRHVQNPYPLIGELSFGKYAREFVRLNVFIMLFGSNVVLLLLGSQLIQKLASIQSLNYCYWVLILGSCLIPPTWLGSPKDFWQAAVGALATSMTAILVVLGTLIKTVATDGVENTEKPEVTFYAVLSAYSTIVFMNGGCATFPTIQNDMKDKSKFSFAVGIASMVLLGTYTTVGSFSYVVLSKDVTQNILVYFPENWSIKLAQACITAHLLLVFLIVMNPVVQDLEKTFKVPARFGYKRAILRTIMVLIIIFVAESVPKFGYILNVIGGSTISFLTFIFPGVFYLKLTSMKAPEGQLWPQWRVSLLEKALLIFMIAFGVVGGVGSTYVAVKKMVSEQSFVAPCYV